MKTFEEESETKESSIHNSTRNDEASDVSVGSTRKSRISKGNKKQSNDFNRQAFKSVCEGIKIKMVKEFLLQNNALHQLVYIRRNFLF